MWTTECAAQSVGTNAEREAKAERKTQSMGANVGTKAASKTQTNGTRSAKHGRKGWGKTWARMLAQRVGRVAFLTVCNFNRLKINTLEIIFTKLKLL
jgi:hypothetical protein